MRKRDSEVIGTRVPKWMPPALESVYRQHPDQFPSRNAVQVEAFRRLLAEYGFAGEKDNARPFRVSPTQGASEDDGDRLAA